MLFSAVEGPGVDRDALRDDIGALGRGGVAVPQSISLQTAIAKDMRVLLVELLIDVRDRSAPASLTGNVALPIVEHVDELVRPASSAPIVDEDVTEQT